MLIGSSALRKFLMILFPFARDEKIIDLCDIDLSGVGEKVPLNVFVLLSSILSNIFPQFPGLFEFFFEGCRIVSPEILACSVKVFFE